MAGDEGGLCRVGAGCGARRASWRTCSSVASDGSWAQRARRRHKRFNRAAAGTTRTRRRSTAGTVAWPMPRTLPKSAATRFTARRRRCGTSGTRISPARSSTGMPSLLRAPWRESDHHPHRRPGGGTSGEYAHEHDIHGWRRLPKSRRFRPGEHALRPLHGCNGSGCALLEALRRTNPDFVILTASAHITNNDHYDEIVDSVLNAPPSLPEDLALRYAHKVSDHPLHILWKTQHSGGCLSEKTGRDAPNTQCYENNEHGTMLYNCATSPQRDERTLATINKATRAAPYLNLGDPKLVPTINVRMLYWREDAHISSMEARGHSLPPLLSQNPSPLLDLPAHATTRPHNAPQVRTFVEALASAHDGV